LENAWNKAEQRRDIPALDQLLAGTLVYTDYDGTFYTKPQFLASVKNASEIIDQLNNDQVSVHAYESSAVVTGVYREKGSLKGKPYVRRGRFTDTWVKQNGSWLCVASQSTLIGH
jgi:ketosteroid isomerase-like protein